jgi:UPF0716 family protein affecting phage T7 exclusion
VVTLRGTTGGWGRVKPWSETADGRHSGRMVAFAVILLVVGLVLLFTGLFVKAVGFLLWLGVAILVIAIIMALLRYIRRSTS